MLWGKNRGNWKSRQSPGVEPRTPLAQAASALPLSHNSRTTTSPHNPLYVLHKWYWMPQSHTWQPLSMCRQNSVRGQPENSLHQERTHAEWLHSLYMHLFPTWGKILWAFRVNKPLLKNHSQRYGYTSIGPDYSLTPIWEGTNSLNWWSTIGTTVISRK